MVKKMMFLIICVLAVCLSSCKNSIDDSSINEDKSFDISDDLITELKLNFKYFFKIVEVMPEPKHETIEIRLDLIKKGYKMIYVKFNPDDYYYACAYHVSDDEDNLYKNISGNKYQDIYKNAVAYFKK